MLNSDLETSQAPSIAENLPKTIIKKLVRSIHLPIDIVRSQIPLLRQCSALTYWGWSKLDPGNENKIKEVGRGTGVSGLAPRHLHWRDAVGATHVFVACALTVAVGGLGLGPFTACRDFPIFTGQENVWTCRQWSTLLGRELLVSWEQSRVVKGLAQVGTQLEHQALQYRTINTFFFWPGNDRKKWPFCSTLSTQKSLAKAKSDHALPKCGCQVVHAATTTVRYWRNGSVS